MTDSSNPEIGFEELSRLAVSEANHNTLKLLGFILFNPTYIYWIKENREVRREE